MALPPSGEQFEIRSGPHVATIVEVGGGLREYAVGERAVLDPYPVEARCDGAHGAPLIPWPNRLGDGRYHFDGAEYQVALTEPEKHNAIHGFLRWRNWKAIERSRHRVVMGTNLYPVTGFPFTLSLSIAYQLGHEGLVVSTTAANLGDQPCPFGSGQHPYLSPGTPLIDDCTLELGAETRILTDDERKLPTGREAVAGTDYDFREAKRLGDQKLDTPFTDLRRDADGLAWARLTAPDGTATELWADEHYSVIEIYTGDTLSPHRRRRGMGTEPMTCPPNGFQTGDGLVTLDPGESLTTHWGLRLVGP